MNLLSQAIQEYLADHHPEWVIVDRASGHIIIEQKLPHPRLYTYILFYISKPAILLIIDGKHHPEITYTEHTLLPQLAEIINKIEKS